MSLELWSAVPPGAREAMPGGHCPRCNGERIHRSRTRNGLESFLRTVSPLRLFTCSSCRWRGWRVPVPSVGPENKLPPMPGPERSRRRQSAKQWKRQDLILKYFRQFILVVTTAFVCAVVFSHCQRGVGTPDGVVER